MRRDAKERADFFLSRRGSVAAIAREVTDILEQEGYKVIVQDYDFTLGTSFVERMHEAIKNCRDLIVLYTGDYEASPYTRKEFTSFEAERVQSAEERHIIVLRCEDAQLRGLLADSTYQDLVGIDEEQERRRRIIAAAERRSQGAPPPPRPFVGVPPRTAAFAGRGDELDRLDAILVRDKPVAVTQSAGRAALRGLGGIGKTTLAIEYAHRFRNLHAGVLWCPAETRAGLLTSLAALAVLLDVVPSDHSDIEVAAKLALHRLAERRSPWLLIYDNVTAPEHIADLLPSSGAKVLITSRFSDWAEWTDEISLDVLPADHAVAFLMNRAKSPDADGALTLARALGFLPLALDHAAAICRRTQMSFGDYASKVSRLIRETPRGASYPQSIAATFDLAISQAVTQCPSALSLMAFLAQCAPERIPISLLKGAMRSEPKRLDALSALVELSLVKHDPFEDGTPAVVVHRLVQSVARARTEAGGKPADARRPLMDRLWAIYPDEGFSDPAVWSDCARLTPHLLALYEVKYHAGHDREGWADLLSRAGGYLHARGSLDVAAPLLREALKIREAELGDSDVDTADSLASLAVLLQDQRQFKKARALFERALAIREAALGADHPDTAESLQDLAGLLQDQGHLAKARALYERALAIREKAMGLKHPDTAETLDRLALVLQDQRQFAAAQGLSERALAIRQKVLGPDHPDTAESLHNLAGLLEDRGETLKALDLFSRAVEIRERVLGADHADTIESRASTTALLPSEDGA